MGHMQKAGNRAGSTTQTSSQGLVPRLTVSDAQDLVGPSAFFWKTEDRPLDSVSGIAKRVGMWLNCWFPRALEKVMNFEDFK